MGCRHIRALWQTRKWAVDKLLALLSFFVVVAAKADAERWHFTGWLLVKFFFFLRFLWRLVFKMMHYRQLLDPTEHLQPRHIKMEPPLALPLSIKPWHKPIKPFFPHPGSLEGCDGHGRHPINNFWRPMSWTFHLLYHLPQCFSTLFGLLLWNTSDCTVIRHASPN